MTTLTPDSPAVRLCAAYCEMSPITVIEAMKREPHETRHWQYAAGEHERLCAEREKNARIWVLRSCLASFPKWQDYKDPNVSLAARHWHDIISNLLSIAEES